MDIDAWIFDRLTRLNKFVAWWKAHHETEPDLFPNDLLPNELEMELAFFENTCHFRSYH
jgi:hypothetical protein